MQAKQLHLHGVKVNISRQMEVQCPQDDTMQAAGGQVLLFFKLEHVGHSFCRVQFLHCVMVQNTNVTRAPVNLAVSGGEFSVSGAGRAGDPQSCSAALHTGTAPPVRTTPARW